MEPQVLELVLGELEHEVTWKALFVPFDRTHQDLGLDPVHGRKIGVEHDLVPTQRQDRALDAFHRDEARLRHRNLRNLRCQSVTSLPMPTKGILPSVVRR